MGTFKLHYALHYAYIRFLFTGVSFGRSQYVDITSGGLTYGLFHVGHNPVRGVGRELLLRNAIRRDQHFLRNRHPYCESTVPPGVFWSTEDQHIRILGAAIRSANTYAGITHVHITDDTIQWDCIVRAGDCSGSCDGIGQADINIGGRFGVHVLLNVGWHESGAVHGSATVSVNVRRCLQHRDLRLRANGWSGSDIPRREGAWSIRFLQVRLLLV